MDTGGGKGGGGGWLIGIQGLGVKGLPNCKVGNEAMKRQRGLLITADLLSKINVLLCIWGFPKIRVNFLGLPLIRTIVC